MHHAAGTRLGPYEILALLGAGGMGEVYRARDTRLGRDVAIKFSNEKFTERFDREARAIAALNHPHICQLYDVGPDYLVMELIDGTPLKGPLPLERAAEYATQILDALDAAHQKGITHRDLKPANILVTKQGIKLLDFGLAKQSAVLNETDATMTRALTQQGQMLGTFQYMSPEQLQGKEVDPRSDLFSFGCVLYEMLNRKSAFDGQSAASVIAAILEREPAPLTIAPRLERVVKRSLAKDPDQRFQTARDLKAALSWAMEQPVPAALAPGRRRWWVATAAVTLVIGAIGGWTVSNFLKKSVSEPVRLAINPPSGTVFSGGSGSSVPAPQFAVSPNGRAIVFIASIDAGRSTLWVRFMEDVTARQLPGTENPSSPFWSPDSRWVGFFADGKLKKTSIDGGPVQALAAVGANRGATWGPDETILFSSANTEITRVTSSGGTPTPVTRLDPSHQEGSHRWPQFLPDGQHFVYLIRSRIPEYRGLYLGSLDGKTKKLLIPIDSAAAYLRSGYLLYNDGDMLLAQPFDVGRFTLDGPPFAVAERVGHGSQSDGAFSASDAGTIAYAGPILHMGHLGWFDREGKELGSATKEGDYTDFRLSPDERQLAASLVDPKTGSIDIWLTDIARSSTSRFTFGFPANASDYWSASAAWSPDSKSVAFRRVRIGVAEIYLKSASGGGKETPLLGEAIQREVLTRASNSVPTDWSPDGRHVLFSTLLSSMQLWLLPVASAGGSGKPFRFADSSSDQMHGNFSPDGRLIAYSSDESGRFEVYVQTFPTSDRKWQISNAGGYEPRWRGDGGEIYYLSGDCKLMAVSVDSGPSFGVPKPLFQTRVLPGVNAGRMNYVPSRDGRRFLINTQEDDPPPNPITVVLNWSAGRKR